MVLDKDLRPLHQLTEVGKLNYLMMLERIADEILFRHEHPLKWAVLKVKEVFAKKD